MLNRIVLMGRLTKNPELRHTQSGTPVASFSLAVDRDFKDKQTGEKATDFIDIVAWRQTAEFVSRFFTKGRMAVVEGRLQLRDWTDRDGNKRRTAEVLAEHVYFGDSKRDAESGGAYTPPPAEPGSGGAEFAELTEDDGELPF
ncbi:single-stranded DNA-binding protein [Flavonifractor plautii]|uniref:Single-stranded DNA-binding protein n=1 Tax=Flavonifractor plautii TaxID=292800 RepID=A0A174E8R6_FLAPL|nr:single-stranded DNA-binding protein [Flavonifractor plautii]MDB7921200.1 single-stranded DNA-binding protein [Flavonifractor plautii]MDB7944988.1 single-stranded DNA-binding protein [Flavonifractor plautii]CUO32390.1 Helix-destabilizing protein [Flavonifractor plautii]